MILAATAERASDCRSHGAWPAQPVVRSYDSGHPPGARFMVRLPSG